MSRFKSLFTAGLLGATLMLASIGAVSADVTVGVNENNGQGPRNDNCVGLVSSAFTGNGANVREEARAGERGEVIREFHDREVPCGL
jgi:hypothetical protein